MSIFSSCVGAPNSLVIMYIEASDTSVISASPCPIPLVSIMIKSKPAVLTISSTSLIAPESSVREPRVARLRMKTRLLKIAFMRIRSPSNAPPVFCFVGSIDRIATFLSGSSRKNRLINSSVSELFPAPPVPVIPRTGVFLVNARACVINPFALASFWSYISSAYVIRLASTSGVSVVTISS